MILHVYPFSNHPAMSTSGNVVVVIAHEGESEATALARSTVEGLNLVDRDDWADALSNTWYRSLFEDVIYHRDMPRLVQPA